MGDAITNPMGHPVGHPVPHRIRHRIGDHIPCTYTYTLTLILHPAPRLASLLGPPPSCHQSLKLTSVCLKFKDGRQIQNRYLSNARVARRNWNCNIPERRNSMASDAELQRIAGAANKLRPEWSAKSVLTILRTHHPDRSFADLAVAVAVLAVDPATQTPARLSEHGPWWVATRLNVGRSETPNVGPGRGARRCDRAGHDHEAADACRLCRAEQLAGEEPEAAARPATPPPAWRPQAPPHPAKHRASDLSQPIPMPPADIATARCRCGATFIDSPAGHESHAAVFGHAPATAREPQETAS